MKILGALLSTSLLVLASVTYYLPLPASAALPSASSFDPGRIIEDSVFVNKNTMTVSQIQSFLESKVPNCASGYTCLKSYKENPTTQVNNYYGGGSVSGGKSAAQIIWDAAQAHNINPQVLLVTLQKETSLVTHTTPPITRYDRAMGYGCPDTGPNNSANCNSTYYGFANQMNLAAMQFRRYMDRMNTSENTYRYEVGSRYIGYHPSTSCGGTTVNIKTKGTAALYNYTPYQPNSASLNSYPGSGNGCSSYGNRNFWFRFHDWFGSTYGSMQLHGNIELSSTYIDDSITATFKLTNTTKNTMELGRIKIAVRDEYGVGYDYPSDESVIIHPGQTYTYSKSRNLGGESDYGFYIARYDDGRWYYPPLAEYGIDSSGDINKRIFKRPTLTSGLSLSPSPSNIHANQDVTATFTITNPSRYSVYIGNTKVAGRDNKGGWFDFAPATKENLAAGESYTYTSTQAFPKEEQYSFWITNKRTGIAWKSDFPTNETSGLSRSQTINVKPAVTLTSGLSLSESNLHVNQDVTATFTIKNHSKQSVYIGNTKVAGRDNKGGWFDFAPATKENLAAGESYTYTSTQAFPKEEQYSFWITNKRTGIAWKSDFPTNETSGLSRSQTINVKPAVTLTSGLSLSESNLHVNQDVTATFTIKNHSKQSVYIGNTKVAGRDNKGGWFDFAPATKENLAAGESYTYTSTQAFPKEEQYSFWITNKRTGIAWKSDFPTNETSGLSRSQTINVKPR